jgi:hypothetical protein
MSSPMHLSVSSSALSALRPSSYAFVLIVIFINSNLTFGLIFGSNLIAVGDRPFVQLAYEGLLLPSL